MAPKRKTKRKAPDVDAASSAQQAPAVAEPVMPDLASLPEADATILGQVVSLGHYPRSLDAKGQKNAKPVRINKKKPAATPCIPKKNYGPPMSGFPRSRKKT